MWTLVALFCNLTEPNKGVCQPAVPPLVFYTREDCIEFAISATTGIDLEQVTYDYQCINWQRT